MHTRERERVSEGQSWESMGEGESHEKGREHDGNGIRERGWEAFG